MITRHTDVRTAQATLRSVYALAPQAARVANHATTVDRDPADPFRATVFVGSGDADVVPVAAERAVGGPNGAPSAGDLFCAALAASQDSAIRIAANLAGIRLAALSVDVRGWVDVRGAMGIDRDTPVGFQTPTALSASSWARPVSRSVVQPLIGRVPLAEAAQR